MGLVWDRVGLVVYFTPSPSCRDSNDESILALAFAVLRYMSWCRDGCTLQFEQWTILWAGQ
jgi:hypothetical protein